VTFGSGDSDSYGFDPNSGRMTQYKFNVSTHSVTGNTTWNPNGSLQQLAIANQLNSADTQTCNYTHEDLGRIESVDCGAAKWQQNFSYDAFGNLTKTVPGGGTGIGFQPGYSASSNWITSLPGITPTTDADGRMTYDGTHSYAWDVEGEMITVDTTTLTHDALGRLVEKNVGGTITEFVYGPMGGKFAQMSGTTLQKAFVPLPTGTAVYTGSGLAYYRHGDHLGSSRLATTPTRTMYSSTAYAPFGEPYAQAGTTDLSFAGHDQDTIAGIHDALFREYPAVQGRWLTPDPAGMAAVDPTNPQSWNRYAYVMNNPTTWIDFAGLDECYAWDISCFIGGDNDGGGDPPPPPGVGPLVYLSQDAGTIPNSGGGNGGNAPNKPKTCTAAQQVAAQLAKSFESASKSSGWIAFGTGVATALSGAGEGITFGGDTPVTITFGSMTGFFGTASVITGGAAGALNSFASGNLTSLNNFGWSQLANLTAKAAASRIPAVERWSETIGDLAEQASDLTQNAAEVCQ
jgi:RHS repeat-associated protein